jgi:hypothetical protein
MLNDNRGDQKKIVPIALNSKGRISKKRAKMGINGQ